MNRRLLFARSLGQADVVELVDAVQQTLPKGRQATVWLPRERLDAARFDKPSTLAGRKRGQTADRRFPLEDGRSLHVVIFRHGWVECHIDAQHPGGLLGIAAHAAADTRTPEGVAAAVGTGALLGLSPVGFAATVAAGVFLGANVPRRSLTRPALPAADKEDGSS